MLFDSRYSNVVIIVSLRSYLTYSATIIPDLTTIWRKTLHANTYLIESHTPGLPER